MSLKKNPNMLKLKKKKKTLSNKAKKAVVFNVKYWSKQSNKGTSFFLFFFYLYTNVYWLLKKNKNDQCNETLQLIS